MNATAIIQVYYPEREANLGPILASIAQVPAIEKVIIWVNGREYQVRVTAPNVEVIQSSFDTLIGQYAAAFLAPSDMIYCQNDDLVVEPKTIQGLLEQAENSPWLMMGILGRDFKRDAAMPNAAGRYVKSGQADVLIGRAWACHKSVLIDGFSRSLDGNVYPGRGEDMFFSYQQSCVVPNAEWTDIPENGIGLCYESGHIEEREQWARYLLAEQHIDKST